MPALPTIPNDSDARPIAARTVVAISAEPRTRSKSKAADTRPDGVGPVVARHRPQRVHGVLHRLANAEASIQRPRDADDDPDRPTAQTLGLPELLTDNGELGDSRLQNLLLQPWVAHQHHSQYGGQQQQGGKQGHECVIGDQRGKVAPLIIDVLVDDRDEEAGDAASPL